MISGRLPETSNEGDNANVVTVLEALTDAAPLENALKRIWELDSIGIILPTSYREMTL